MLLVYWKNTFRRNNGNSLMLQYIAFCIEIIIINVKKQNLNNANFEFKEV